MKNIPDNILLPTIDLAEILLKAQYVLIKKTSLNSRPDKCEGCSK